MADRTADLKGNQQKVTGAWVRPARAMHGSSGIPVQDGRTLPFIVGRQWNAPAGRYRESWYLIDPATREVLHEGPVKQLLVLGLSSYTDVEDRVADPIPLAPGTYGIVLALGGILGAEIEVEAVEVSSAAA